MMNHLFKHVNIDVTRTHVPDGTEPDSEKACSDYEAIVESYGGVDLQLLGLATMDISDLTSLLMNSRRLPTV